MQSWALSPAEGSVRSRGPPSSWGELCALFESAVLHRHPRGHAPRGLLGLLWVQGARLTQYRCAGARVVRVPQLLFLRALDETVGGVPLHLAQPHGAWSDQP